MFIEIIIAFLGIIIGLILARFTKEELRPGKKYFIWFKKIILLILVVTLIHFSLTKIFFIRDFVFTLIGLIIGLFVGYFFKKEYFYFGFVLYLLAYTSSFLFISILIFLFGLPYGTLLFTKKYKYNTLLYDFIAFIFPLTLLPIFLYLINYPIINFYYIHSAFIAGITGALFTLIFKVNKK